MTKIIEVVRPSIGFGKEGEHRWKNQCPYRLMDLIPDGPPDKNGHFSFKNRNRCIHPDFFISGLPIDNPCPDPDNFPKDCPLKDREKLEAQIVKSYELRHDQMANLLHKLKTSLMNSSPK